jgi:soluble lytic murein transglycosylase-like protein
VRVGDTMSGIAARYHVGLAALARANHMRVEGVLVRGRLLRLPGGGEAPASRTSTAAVRTLRGRYRVRPGDTLSGIAVRYRLSLTTLARANGLNPRRVLVSGRVLHVPATAARRSTRTTTTTSVSLPALSHLTVRGLIDRWAAHYGVRASLARALAWQESGYQTSIVSVAGAWGVMQVTPETWDYVETILIGQRIPHTADGNVRVGVAYLRSLLQLFGGDERRALAAYYQGARSVRANGVLAETRRYVANVLALSSRL